MTEAYARLKALKGNVPKDQTLLIYWLDEFNTALNLLQQASAQDLSRFAVPSGAIHNLEGKPHRVNRDMLMTRLDTLLTFFAIETAEPPLRIGFNPS